MKLYTIMLEKGIRICTETSHHNRIQKLSIKYLVFILFTRLSVLNGKCLNVEIISFPSVTDGNYFKYNFIAMQSSFNNMFISVFLEFIFSVYNCN